MENLRKSGKYNRVSSEQPRIKHFREFLTGRDIIFSEITVPLRNRFKVYLKATRRAGDRTVVNHLMLIRPVFNQTTTADLTEAKHYPIEKGEIMIKFPESVKLGLNVNEVKMLENADWSKALAFWYYARNLWLISFYFARIRVSDVLRLKHADFQDDRTRYKMGKRQSWLCEGGGKRHAHYRTVPKE